MLILVHGLQKIYYLNRKR